MTEIQHHINRCKTLIEEKLGWGDSSDWQSQDFENLSDLIFNKTSVVLSASTLKRIWGKVRYNSTPNLSTLDTLSRFIGFANWRSFANYSAPQPPLTVAAPSKRTSVRPMYLFIALFIALVPIVFVLYRKSGSPLHYTDIAFSSRPVTSGVPNTVIFTYDATQSNADSIFIQQNWDAKRRVQVAKDHHEHASIYYLPGYYRAKLILNDSIVKEHDVFIESKDWIGVLMKDPVPFYLPFERYDHGSWLGITQKDLKQDPDDYSLDIPEFVLTHVHQSLAVDSKHFSADMYIQNTYIHPGAPCQHSELILLGTEGAIVIPLSNPGCVAELKLRLGDRLVEGTSRDLSAFGVNFSSPVPLRCVAKDGKIQIDINRKPAYQGLFPEGIGQIVGARITFQGAGRISAFQLAEVL